MTEQQFQELIGWLDELQDENQRLRGRLNDMENPTAAAGTSQQDRHRTRPKPANPQPFDLASDDANVHTWLFSLNMYFQAAEIGEDDEVRILFAVTLLQGAALEWWRQMTLLSKRLVTTGAARGAAFKVQ